MSKMASTLHAQTDQFTLRSTAVSEMDNRVYLLTNRLTGSQVLVDAAADFPALKAFTRQALAEDAPGRTADPGAGVQALFTTHSHWDHIRALPQAVRSWNPTTFCGAADAAAISRQEQVEVDHLLKGGEHLELAGAVWEVISLRGHTPGSIALALVLDGSREAEGAGRTLLITGDSLFPGGVGKTESPQDFEQLFTDVSRRIFDRFADDTLVLPGHGEPTTLGAERPQLPAWQRRGY